MKLAIISPGFMPIPSVKGGAIEQLITNFIQANDQYHLYDIDVYTVADSKLNSYSFKYTNIIQVDNLQQFVFIKGYYFIKNKLFDFFKLSGNRDFISYKFFKLYKQNYYDITLIENNMDIFNSIIRKKTKEKFVFHLHNDFNNGDAGKSYKKTMKVIHSAYKIIVVSNYLQNKLFSLGARNVYVVYNGIISKNFVALSNIDRTNMRKRYGYGPNDCVFAFIGRLSKEKGADTFLKALKLLKGYKSIRGLIIGDTLSNFKDESEYKKHLLNLANELKEKIRFAGYVDNKELYKLYSISDCVVIPSQVEEAFGMVALEAMMMKKPVIASNSGGLPEVLSSEGSIIIEKGESFIKKLADAMCSISNRKKDREQMGLLNLEKCKKFPNNEYEYFASLSKQLNG